MRKIRTWNMHESAICQREIITTIAAWGACSMTEITAGVRLATNRDWERWMITLELNTLIVDGIVRISDEGDRFSLTEQGLL